jgi:uncharacterized protein (UPF0254 family)
VRTTIDLPDDLHRIAASIARDKAQTLSETVAELMRRGLGTNTGVEMSINPDTGLPVVRTGVPITTDDVRALEDD